MTAAEREWEPGDPLMPDNGCGPMTGVNLTAEERDAVIAEGGYRPQWWRPGPEPGGLASTRYCAPCDVRWAGADPCWMCGGGSTL